MNNWEKNKEKFARLGINHYTLPTDMFDWLKIKSFEAKDNFNDARERLVGHIQREYFITSAVRDKKDLKVDNDPIYLQFKDWLSHHSFKKPANMFGGSNYILNNDRSLCISSLWVNFQKKYEFNPPHTHGGLFSFIIFVNIPYNFKNELEYFSVGKPGADPHTSKLYFLTLCPLSENNNGISVTMLDVDQSYEGKILIFPSNLTHGVHPFYTSDDYRITMSGNLVFDV